MNKNVLIYWLSQIDCEMMHDDIGSPRLDALPTYIVEQLESCYGRAGRGRLWVDPSIGISEMEWNDDSPIAKYAARCAGIAIRSEDLAALAGLPGFVTDLSLHIVS